MSRPDADLLCQVRNYRERAKHARHLVRGISCEDVIGRLTRYAERLEVAATRMEQQVADPADKSDRGPDASG